MPEKGDGINQNRKLCGFHGISLWSFVELVGFVAPTRLNSARCGGDQVLPLISRRTQAKGCLIHVEDFVCGFASANNLSQSSKSGFNTSCVLFHRAISFDEHFTILNSSECRRLMMRPTKVPS
jgi:hypothetical protein